LDAWLKRITNVDENNKFMLLRLRNPTASMVSMAHHQERIATNLANANTVGFKRDRVFIEALNERIDAEGAPQSDRVPTQWADMESGGLKSTGNPLDVALQGDGFFAVTNAEGEERYTRAGRFMIDSDRTLRTPSGLAVQGQGGPIEVPDRPGDIQITQDGRLQMNGQEFGRLRVVRFDNPLLLERREGATFAAPTTVPIEMERPTILQGQLEASNVNPVKTMTDMITHYRLFETQQRMMRTADTLLGRVSKDLGTF
jgi:flagellar basal-body rod protein FlgF/flagellar basal-body rod protein FlgG